MKSSSVVLIAFLAGGMLIAAPAQAKKKKNAATQASTQPASPEEAAKEAAALSSRADGVVASLDLDDPAKAARVHDALVAQYRAIHDWHTANDTARKAASSSTQPSDEAAQIQASYQALHDHFITALSADLTPEQIDQVKEKMTGGQMTATLRNYPAIVPNLTDDDKAMIQKTLLDARDDAMDAGSKNERIAIFKKYKGRINIYLNAHGHNVAQAYKDWGAAQKAKQSGAATQPEANSGEN